MPSDRYLRADEVALLERCDFFAGDRDDFFAGVISPSCLCQGTHKQPTPLVSIVITTYKRPQWLKVALDSALNQVGFNDYEIVVVDNECADILRETATSELMRQYVGKNVVYYRNRIPAKSRIDTAVACAKTPYICMLHDDVFLAPQHLQIMASVLKEHPDISFLSCERLAFDTDAYAAVRTQRGTAVPREPSLRRYTCASASIGCYPDWLGAFIAREKYIDIGGVSGKIPFSTGIGDSIMIMPFMDNLYRFLMSA